MGSISSTFTGHHAYIKMTQAARLRAQTEYFMKPLTGNDLVECEGELISLWNTTLINDVAYTGFKLLAPENKKQWWYLAY